MAVTTRAARRRHIAALAFATGMSCTGAAWAAHTYTIQLDGYCNTYQFTVENGLIAGASIYQNGGACDNSYLTGTIVNLPATVAPGGRAAVLSGDLGNPFGFAILTYINFADHTWVEYATADPNSGLTGQSAQAGTWSFVKGGGATKAKASLPALSSVLLHQRPIFP